MTIVGMMVTTSPGASPAASLTPLAGPPILDQLELDLRHLSCITVVIVARPRVRLTVVRIARVLGLGPGSLVLAPLVLMPLVVMPFVVMPVGARAVNVTVMTIPLVAATRVRPIIVSRAVARAVIARAVIARAVIARAVIARAVIARVVFTAPVAGTRTRDGAAASIGTATSRAAGPDE